MVQAITLDAGARGRRGQGAPDVDRRDRLAVLGRREDVADDLVAEIASHLAAAARDALSAETRLPDERLLHRRGAQRRGHAARRPRRAPPCTCRPSTVTTRRDADDRVARRGMRELHVRHALARRASPAPRSPSAISCSPSAVAIMPVKKSLGGDRARRRSGRRRESWRRARPARSADRRPGSACATLPPIVPRLRTAGSPTCAAASASTGQCRRQLGRAASSACVVSAPMRIVAAARRMPFSSGDAADVDERRRRRQPQLHQRDQAVPAGQQLRAGMLREQLLRVADRARAVVVEGCANTCSPAPFRASAIARHTLSGVSGISQRSARRTARARRSPRCTPCTVDAIVPASPMPLTPSG